MTAALIWARSEIRRGWLSLLVVALLVAITGGAVMAGVAGARRAGNAVDRFVTDSRPSDIVIFTFGGPLDPAVRAQIDGDPRTRTTSESEIALVTPTSLIPGLEGGTFILPDEYWGKLARPRLAAGTYPVGTDEIAVTERAAESGHHAVGDVIELHRWPFDVALACLESGARGDDLSDCAPTIDAGTATITGIVRTSSDLAPGAFNDGLFIAEKDFRTARGPDDPAWGVLTDVYLNRREDIDDFVRDFSIVVGDRGDVTSAVDDLDGAIQAVTLQRNALLIGSAIAAGAGLLISGQAFARFLTRRSGDTTTLAALGMPTGQRTLTGFVPGFVAAAVGAALSIPIAIALSPLFPLRIARRADPDVGFHADWEVLTVGFLIVVTIGSFAAFVSSALWSRRRVTTAKATSLSVVAVLATRFGFGPAPTMGSRFALEPGHGTRHAPVVPSLLGSAVAVTVVVGALVLTTSLDGLVGSSERYGAPWDLQMAVDETYESIAARVAEDERVDGVSVAISGELNITGGDGETSQGFALGLNTVKGSVEPVVLDGRAPVGSNEILVGSTTMERSDIDVGDEVTISGPNGSQQVIVVGRAVVPIVSSASTDVGMVVPLDTFLELGGTETVSDIDVQAALFVTAQPDDVDAVTRQVEAAGGMIDGPFVQSKVSALDEVRGIPVFVAGFTALIGTLAVFHALYVTSRRRRSDLAVMRALGYRPRQTSRVINWQGFFLTLAALAIGTPAGLVVGRLMWTAIADDNNVLAVIDTPWAVIAVFAAVALVGAAFILAAGPAWSSRRRAPAADLRAE